FSFSARSSCSTLFPYTTLFRSHRWKAWYVGRYIFPVHWIAFLAIWFMVFLSLVSAVDYFAAFWSKIDRRVVKRRRRAFVLSRRRDRKSTRLNSSHEWISYAVFC